MRILLLHRPDGPQGGDDLATAGYAEALRRLGHAVESRPAHHLGDFGGYDFVHIWSACSPDWALPAAREVKRQKRPLIITPNWWNRKARLEYYGVGDDVAPGYTNAVGATLDLADVLFTCTMSEAAECWKLTPRKQVFHVGHGCDPIDLKPKEAPEPFVLCAARIEPHKNQINLALACKMLGVTLLLLGDVSSAYAAKVNAIGAVMLGQRPHDEVFRWMLRARVHALPSFSETPGMANMEAARLKVPAVMGNIGAEIEFFGAGGIYCDPREPLDIAEAIRIAWDAPRVQWANIDTWDEVAYRALAWMKGQSS